MTKKFLTFGILAIVLVGIFVPNVVFGADIAKDSLIQSVGPAGYLINSYLEGDSYVQSFFKGVSQFLMMISSFVLIFSGMIIDWILKFTIVDMAKNIGGSTGVGGSITTAWATLRDVANMAFIFVLLYAAFKTMFDANFSAFGTTVKNIIIVALLINFSLFFSKVVIDASNIVSVGFYNSIISSNNEAQLGKSPVLGSVDNFKGISGGYMKMLGMQTLYSADILNPTDTKGKSIKLDAVQILVIGVMSSIFMLIVSVMLLIIGIMLTARFIILIFLMILSPLAFIAFIIPGQDKHFTEWKKALIDQSFFAPLYFALTWVVFKLGSSLIKTITENPTLGPQKDFANMFNDPGSAVALIINYILIIGFSIAALIFAKQMASKTAGFKAVSGGIASGTAWGLRQAVGKPSRWIMESETLRKAEKKGGVIGGIARGASWATYRGAKGSFDVRGIEKTKLGKAMGTAEIGGKGVFSDLGKAGGEGGVIKARQKYLDSKEKEKSEESKARYGESERAKYSREELEEGKRKMDEQFKDAVAKEKEKVAEDLRKAKAEYERLRNLKVEYPGKEDDTRKAEEIYKEASKKLEDINKNRYQFPEEVRNLQAEAAKLGETAKAIKETSKDRQMAYAERLSDSAFASMRGLKAASQKIRNIAQGKDKKSAKEFEKILRDAGYLEKKEEGEGGKEEKSEEKKEPKPTGSTTETK